MTRFAAFCVEGDVEYYGDAMRRFINAAYLGSFDTDQQARDVIEKDALKGVEGRFSPHRFYGEVFEVENGNLSLKWVGEKEVNQYVWVWANR